MKINLDNCETSAQAVTNICYNEKTRNLNFRITCDDLEDLKKCVQIIDQYNDFDYKNVNDAVELYANLKRYYNENNPNNGKDLLTFDIGRESSPVMYIKYFNLSLSGNKYQTKEHGEIEDLTPEKFENDMKALAEVAKADECDIGDDGCYRYCRLWWD